MKKVILAHRYHDEAVERLRREFQLLIADDEGGLAACLQRHPDAAALVSFLSDPVDAAAIDAMKKLKVIANFAVGYNNIDVGRALARNVLVTHTPDVLTNATADLTMALMLAVSRRLVEGDAVVRSGRFSGWQAGLLLGKELNGAILGIVGMGRIGLAVALRARAFGMKVVFYSRSAKPQHRKEVRLRPRHLPGADPQRRRRLAAPALLARGAPLVQPRRLRSDEEGRHLHQHRPRSADGRGSPGHGARKAGALRRRP